MASIDHHRESKTDNRNEAPKESGRSFVDELPEGVRAEIKEQPSIEVSEYVPPEHSYETDAEIYYPGNPHRDQKPKDDELEGIIEEESKPEFVNSVLVQPIASGRESLSWQLSHEARNAEPDPESTYDEPHQPDAGVGAKALAAAHATRIQVALKAGEFKEDEERKIAAVAVDSRHGTEVRDFLKGLEEYDAAHETNTAARTKVVVLCTDDRREVIEESGVLQGYQVEYQAYDKDNLQLPENTGTVMLDRTLNRLPAYKLHQVANSAGPTHIKETHNATFLAGVDTPLITIDEAGQARAVPAGRMHADGHMSPAKDPKVLYHKYYPQMASRLHQDKGFHLDAAKQSYLDDNERINREWSQKKEEAEAKLEGEALQRAEAKLEKIYSARLEERHLEFLRDGQYRGLGDELIRQEDRVREFMNRPDVPEFAAVHYSPDAIKMLEQVAEQARPDALILVSGLKRDDIENDENKLSPKDLSVNKGPLVTNIVDRPLLRAALKDEGTHHAVPGEPGAHSNELIDLAKGAKVWPAATAYTDVLSRPRETAEAFVGSARMILRQYDERREELDKAIERIENNYQGAVKENPHVADDFELANGMARLFNEYTKYDQEKYKDGVPEYANRAAKASMMYAQRAAQLIPSASAPQLEIAKAQYFLGDNDAAAGALARAQELSPRNADIYRLGAQVAYQRQDLPAYIANMQNLLRYETGASAKDTVDNLYKLCNAMHTDYLINADNMQVHKTILAEDTETGKRSLRAISVADAKRIQAADAWLAAQGAVEELMNHQPYDTGSNQERDRIAQMFAEGYDEIRPYTMAVDERTGEVKREYLPRDSWHDRPPIDSNERFVYVGDMHEGDAKVPPHALYEMMRDGQQEAATQEVARRTAESYTLPAHGELVVGVEYNPETGETKEGVGIPVELLSAHMLITGQTGSGKSEAIKNMLEQFGEMNKSYTVINASDKPGEYDEMAARDGARVIRVGIDDVSLRILDPNMAAGDTMQEKVATAIENFKSYLKVAYGLPQPLDSMFDKTAYKVFAANGWDTGNPDYPVASMSPTIPTIAQLVEEWPNTVSADYEASGKPGEQTGLMRGFGPNRLYPMGKEGTGAATDASKGFVSKALINGPAIDMEEVLSGKVVLEFGYIADDDLRRLAVVAWTQRMTDYMKEKAAREGYNGGVQHFVVIDEAHMVVPADAASDNEQEETARRGAVKVFADKIRQSRGYGMSFITATQQLDTIHSSFVENAGLRITGMQQGVDAKERTAQTAAASKEDALKLQEKLHNLRTGEAVVSGAGIGTITVRLPYHPERIPSREERIRALRDQPPPPTIPEKVDHKAAAELARSQRATALRLSVETEIISALAGIEQPPEVLPEAQVLYRQVAAQDPDLADEMVSIVVGRAIDMRSIGIRDSHKAVHMGPVTAKYQQAEMTMNGSTKTVLIEDAKTDERRISQEAARKPQELAKEIRATVLGKLKGEPTGHGRYTNARHVLPHLAVLKSTVHASQPYYRKPPKEDNFAKPIPHKLPGRQISEKQRVKERQEALKQHAFAFERWMEKDKLDETNRRIAYRALMGDDGGAKFYYDLDVYGEGGMSPFERRRMLVAGVGAVALRDPDTRSLDEALHMPTYIFDS